LRERLDVPTMELQLGVGQYTADEVAQYARLSLRTVKAWFFPGAKDPDRYLTFEDFVEALAVRTILLHRRGIPLDAIRQAVVDAEEGAFEMKKPLAKPHTILLADKKAAIEPRWVRGLPHPPELPGCDLVIDHHQYQVEFGTDEKPVRYWAFWRLPDPGTFVLVGSSEQTAKWRFDLGLGHKPLQGVVLDPGIRLGEPVVLPSMYSAATLWKALLAEGGVVAAAKAYGVEPGEVMVARDYFDLLEGEVRA
jgi:hypothetical protein